MNIRNNLKIIFTVVIVLLTYSITTDIITSDVHTIRFPKMNQSAHFNTKMRQHNSGLTVNSQSQSWTTSFQSGELNAGRQSKEEKPSVYSSTNYNYSIAKSTNTYTDKSNYNNVSMPVGQQNEFYGSRQKRNNTENGYTQSAIPISAKGLISELNKKYRPATTNQLNSDLLSNSDMLAINDNRQNVAENPGEPDYGSVPVSNQTFILILFLLIYFIFKYQSNKQSKSNSNPL